MQCNNLINLDFALLCTINDNETLKFFVKVKFHSNENIEFSLDSIVKKQDANYYSLCIENLFAIFIIYENNIEKINFEKT
jgi:hypothetical protein